MLSYRVITSSFTFLTPIFARAKGEKPEELKMEMKIIFPTDSLINETTYLEKLWDLELWLDSFQNAQFGQGEF